MKILWLVEPWNFTNTVENKQWREKLNSGRSKSLLLIALLAFLKNESCYRLVKLIHIKRAPQRSLQVSPVLRRQSNFRYVPNCRIVARMAQVLGMEMILPQPAYQ